MKNFSNNLKLGLTLVEVLVATSIILVFLIALLGAHNLYLKTAFANGNVIKGVYLVEEGVEVARFLRDSSWSNNIATLSLDTGYHLIFENEEWRATTTNILVDAIFERVVTLSAVYRDTNGDIVSSGGVVDQNIRLVVSTVSWPSGGATTTKLISTYITNIFNN